LSGLFSGLASFSKGSLSDMIKNIGSVGPAALVGTQPVRNVPGAAAAAPAAAPRVVAAQQPQQQQPQQQQPQHDEQDLDQPDPPIPLDTLQKLQAYLNLCPPGLTELILERCRINSVAGVIFPNGLLELDLSENQITTLTGVQFPDGLTRLNLFGNQITSFNGVRFPPNLLDLNLDGNQITTLRGVQFPPSLLELSITDTKINSFAGFRIPPNLLQLYLSDNEITSLQGVQFPPRLTLLNLQNNKIKSLQGVQFPIGLLRLILSFNGITSLTGVQFPLSLTELHLENNQISPLNRWGSPFEGVVFPPSLLVLNLSNNNLKVLYRLQFPPNITSLNLEGNPLRSLTGIINPNEYVMEYLKHNFASVYFRDLHTQHKGAKLAEKSALKAVRQSQKAELHKMTDLSQQSMRNQLNAVTSFLHDGMAARAMEHNEQVQSRMGNKIFVRMVNDMLYYVPFSPTMTVQDVLDYLNNNYYVSVLIPNHGAMSLMVGSTQLDEPLQRLADRNIQNDSTLHAVGKMIPLQGGGTRRSSSNQRRSQRRRNKSIKKK